MNASHQQHKANAPQSLSCAAITVSDTRTEETDTGGRLLRELLEQAGHVVAFRRIIPDEPRIMRELLEELRAREDIQVILMTGGTGISPRDQTYETVSGLLTKPLPGYGELFRMLSYPRSCIHLT